jgi:hypothetical protein
MVPTVVLSENAPFSTVIEACPLTWDDYLAVTASNRLLGTCACQCVGRSAILHEGTIAGVTKMGA